MPTSTTKQRNRSRNDPQKVAGTHVRSVDRDGMPGDLYFARCSGCGVRRRHMADGLRRCPGCRELYVIVVTAVIS